MGARKSYLKKGDSSLLHPALDPVLLPLQNRLNAVIIIPEEGLTSCTLGYRWDFFIFHRMEVKGVQREVREGRELGTPGQMQSGVMDTNCTVNEYL